MQKIPNLILVDDHLLFRHSIKSILTNENIACVIGEANNGIEFLELLLKLRPDLVLMDINMPQMNGIVATQKAIERYPDLKIIAYTMFGEDDYYQKMIALGVKGFIKKSSSITELEKAIDEVMMGNTYFSDKFQRKTNNTSEDLITNSLGNISITGDKYTESPNSQSITNLLKNHKF
jgi:DNA-binding NarL/FixJ family response regulator